MAEQTTQQEINQIVWNACDTFRGTLDPSQYKDYILVMLFLKYVSDIWKDKREDYLRQYKGDEKLVDRKMNRERFIIPDQCDFDSIYSKREASNLGELINIALEKIEDANKAKLENVFRGIDFNSEPNLGDTKERNRRLKNLLNDFANPKLDLRPSRIGRNDIIGNVYEYLIGHFASDAGKKGGEFYTPPEVSMLLAKLLQPKPGDKICDPACGSGSLLIRVAQEVKNENFSIFGQESNGQTWSLCRMNMFLHGMDSARIECCNTLTDPKLIQDDKLMKFNIVIANPPFSLKKWGAEKAVNEKWNRFWRGTPPRSKADYAFISHMIEVALEDEGKVGVIAPHGVLFRGGAEGKIRQQLIEENLLEAVIGLPPACFYGTPIPVTILIFNKGKKTKDILFIEASREFEKGKNQNKLRDQDREKIINTYKAFKSVAKYAYRAKFEKIKNNEFDLNIPKYVDFIEEEEEIDIVTCQQEIKNVENELRKTREEIANSLRELGLSK